MPLSRDLGGPCDWVTTLCRRSPEVYRIEDFATRSRKSFPRYGGALLMRVSLDTIEDKPEALSQEPGARLSILDFASGMDTGDGVDWLESTCWSDMLDIVSNFGLGPERPFPSSGGIMKFPDVLGTIANEPGILSPGSDAMFIWPNFASDFGPGPRRILLENSILNVWFWRDMLDLVCLVIKGTDMGPVHCRWSVGLFASDALRIQLDNPVILRVVTVMGNNGLL